MTENAVRVAVFRMRRRYGDLLREQVADTVTSPQEVPAELEHRLTLPNLSPYLPGEACWLHNLFPSVPIRGSIAFSRMKRARVIPMLLLAAWQAIGAEPKSPTTTSVQSVQVRGRVVCLAEEMHRAHGALLPTSHEHAWGFKAQDGTCYTLLRSKFSEAIFLDERLREKELVLKVKLFPQSLVLEVATIRSLREGKVQDLYYYCDVCAIKAVSPEPCACCQGPMELREGPLSAHDN